MDHFTINKSCDREVKARFSTLAESFRNKFQKNADFFIRVPGRVNLIGEHVDYNGYDVLPMAIEQSLFIAIKADVDSKNVILSNQNSQDYPDYCFQLDDIEIRNEFGKSPAWYEYALCGFKGIIEKFPNVPLRGLLFYVHGTIPPSAGLSSSSALVCSTALSLMIVLKENVSRIELAEITAKCERFIGTQGGGMDQAIIFNGKHGTASRVSFSPLQLKEVKIPSSGVFIIAQSLVQKNKAASNDFNSRVVECRLSALILAKKNEIKNWEDYTKLKDVQQALGKNLEDTIKVVENTFHDDYYSKEEICQLLDVNVVKLEDTFLTKDTKHLQRFKLKPRALHVFGEALRTDKFYEICQADGSLLDLGKLMNESHRSLKDLYECSHPDLDELVSICKQQKAFGARLTGAGWGGCVVALINIEKIEPFIASLRNLFYKNKVTEKNVDELIFATAPQDGVQIFDVSVIE